ncbi:MAG: glycosyltransferase family 2 protein [Oscillospiraceae bacterium]
MSKLSIVIPVYYNQDNLLPLYTDIKKKIVATPEFSYEIVMVDDGSKDDSWAVMQELAAGDENVRTIKLSRNFGSHAAILCGLASCTGDCAVIKAADLQEPTEIILDMYSSWQRGNNVVLAVRKGREDKSFFSSAYYWITRKFALENMPKGGFDVFLIDRKVIEVLEKLDEKNSAITGQILWSGFKTDQIYYTRKQREIGKSRWTLKKKVKLVADTLFGFSNLPIAAVTAVGVMSCAGSSVWAVYVLIGKIMGDIPIQGFTTLFIFQLFSFGIIMLTLGILGGYIWRSFDASRNRPVYIIEEKPRDEKNTEEKPL